MTDTARTTRVTLAVLTAIAMVQFFDRSLIVVVMEPIKHEFDLSDTALGILAGFSYAAAFALAGLPLGWLSDRTHRRNLLAALLALWSAAVAFAGAAGSFATLVATRVVVGAADAGGQPCSISMLSDLYPRERRAGAVAVMFTGVPLGMLLGFLGGGLVAGHFGWRHAFLFAAVPGIVLVAALLLWVREPPRGAMDHSPVATAAPPLATTLHFMWQQRALVAVIAASVLVTVTASAMMSWIGSLLVRTHGLSLAEVGLMTALCMGGAGAIGTLVAGRAADALGRRDMRWQPWLMAAAAGVLAISGAGVALLPSVTAVAMALAVFAFCVAGLNGPTYALSQSLVGVRMRGMSMSTLIVLLNLVGVGIGPTLAGVLSDAFAHHFGAASMRWSMVCLLTLNLPAIVLFVRAATTIRGDLVLAETA